MARWKEVYDLSMEIGNYATTARKQLEKYTARCGDEHNFYYRFQYEALKQAELYLAEYSKHLRGQLEAKEEA